MKKLLLILLVLSGMVPALYGASLVWVPSSALWDTTSFNWSNTVTASSTTFVGGDSVRFDDEGLTQPLVRFVGTLTAGDVVVDSSGDYLFRTNTTSTEGISSLTSLTKRGTGKLTVEADKSFSGPVSIKDGDAAAPSRAHELSKTAMSSAARLRRIGDSRGRVDPRLQPARGQ